MDRPVFFEDRGLGTTQLLSDVRPVPVSDASHRILARRTPGSKRRARCRCRGRRASVARRQVASASGAARDGGHASLSSTPGTATSGYISRNMPINLNFLSLRCRLLLIFVWVQSWTSAPFRRELNDVERLSIALLDAAISRSVQALAPVRCVCVSRRRLGRRGRPPSPSFLWQPLEPATATAGRNTLATPSHLGAASVSNGARCRARS